MKRESKHIEEKSLATKQHKKKQEDWPYELFVKHAELYLPVLEAMKEQGEKEVEGLLNIFKEFNLTRNIKILDLSCGIGRHSIPLAKGGYEVVGFDPSPLYIKKAKESARIEQLSQNAIRFYQGNITDIIKVLKDAGESAFNIIISIFSSIGYQGEEADCQLFKRLLNLTSNDCLFILETANRDAIVRHAVPYEITSITENMELHEIRHLNPLNSHMESDWKFYENISAKGRILKLVLNLPIRYRVYSLHELKNLLDKSGWEYVKSYGGLSLGNISFDSYRIVLVGKIKKF